MSDESKIAIPHLTELAEFRFQLRGFLSFSETASEQAGIAAQQYQLMQVIEATPTDKLSSITYIAERMVLKHNSAVELVDRAERVGLVSRKQDESDLRRSVVSLTEKGRDILSRLVPMHLAELEKRSNIIVKALNSLHESVGATKGE
jgi:DNA-binding MarR family transcriptional regulator